MSRMDKELGARLRSAPDTRERVIVRTASNPSQYASSLEAVGLRVLHVSTLINAITVEGPAKAILKLSAMDWVEALEPDRPVHTMDNP